MEFQQQGWKKLTHPMVWTFVLFFFFPKLPFIGKYLSLGTEVMIWSLFAVGFNILLGYTGLTSFGHGAYFGIGAYTAGIIFLRVYPGFWIPLLLSIVGGALFAGLVGLIVARKRGIYFSLLTIAFGQVFYFIAFRWEELTGGETGLSKIDRIPIGIPGLFQIKLSTPIHYYYVCWAVFLIATIVVSDRNSRPVSNKTVDPHSLLLCLLGRLPDCHDRCLEDCPLALRQGDPGN